MVAENIVLDGKELAEVSADESVPGARRAVEVNVGELDATIDEEP